MARSAVEVFGDRALDPASRVAAAVELERLVATEFPIGEVFSLLHSVAADTADDTEVRCAAVRALALGPGAAAGQLVRRFDDPDRAVRRAAVSALRSMTMPAYMKARLAEALDAATGPDPLHSLLNLAMTFGYDQQIVAVYEHALRSPIPEIRVAAVRGLAMIGETAAAVAATADPDPAVRVEAAHCLAGWSALDAAEIEAVRLFGEDSEPAVAKAGRTAARILGLQAISRPERVSRSEAPDPFGWRSLLNRISARWLADLDHAATLDDAVILRGWLGRSPASPADVVALERRIGQTLPASFAAFLAVTDGFGRVSASIDEVFGAALVRPFADEHADWIAAYSEHDPELGRDLTAAWQVGAADDGVLLLHPDRIGDDGEWQASLFANWVPGMQTYPSFLTLIRAIADS